MEKKIQSRGGALRYIISLCLLALLSQCTPKAVDRQVDSPCRLEQMTCHMVTTGSGTNDSDITEKTVYTYDAAGQLVGQTDRTAYRYSPADSSVSTTARVLMYDASGLLISEAITSQDTDSGVVRNSTVRRVYTYANGRLAQATTDKLDYIGWQTKLVQTYTHDEAGMLSQRTDATTYPVIPTPGKPKYPDGFTQTWFYKNGQATDCVQQAGGQTTKPYTFQNGLITSALTSNSDQTRYTYDSQRRVVGVDYLTNGARTGYTELVYGPAKTPESSLPLFKGFPVVADPYGQTGPTTAYRIYTLSSNGIVNLTSDWQTKYVLTGSGYVRESVAAITITRNSPKPLTYPIAMTINYVYSGGCD
ncbi:hypothetical protein [Fibrella aquatilis]|uniref:YD repeat-containing protein n=1 Tax=Fibrella aquatilis TaxID=2817059 RepID=A0A939G415_9BACT|nr:hypothetical protein [Fibrella aquatilis]MBO0930695.1 hypothetical protein [Fibrella aquatilis]